MKISTFMIGSSSTGAQAAMPSFMASLAAIWNAMSEESTRMIGAVGQVHRHIDHRKAQRTGLQIVAHAGLDRLDILLRHDAAGDRVGELEAAAARQRLDLEHHVAELAVAARLLLVAAALA